MTPTNSIYDRIQDYLSVFHDFRSEKGETLTQVFECSEDHCKNLYILRFESRSLLLSANEADDTIDVAAQPNVSPLHESCVCVSDNQPWKHLVGTDFGWGWVVINQQGYCDGVMLSFGGIVPTVLFTVMASSITVSVISATRKSKTAM